MSDIDELYEKAKEKLEAESFQYGTPEDVIRSICLEWLEWLEWARTNNTKAVELLADAAKDTEGAYKAMENFARNNKRSSSCVTLEPLEAIACVISFGTMEISTRETIIQARGKYNKDLPEDAEAFVKKFEHEVLEPLRTIAISLDGVA